MLKNLLYSLLFFSFTTVSAFEFDENDHWYYEHESESGIKTVPDKMAHFYRSYILVQKIDYRLVLIGNVAYEFWDENRGVGFSIKDLVADTFGVIAGSRIHPDIFPLVEWQSELKSITLTIYWRFE